MDARVVRGAVQNRAPRLVIKDENPELKYYFGIPYPDLFHQGKWRFVSVGGAAKLTKEGRVEVQRRFPGLRFRSNSMDVRFTVSETDLDQVLAVFLERGEDAAETDTSREIWEELCGVELPKQILPSSDFRSIEFRYVTPMYQPRVGMAASVHEPDQLVRRLLRLYELVVPMEVFRKLEKSPYVRFFLPEQLPGVDDPDPKKVLDPKDPSRTIEIANNLFVF